MATNFLDYTRKMEMFRKAKNDALVDRMISGQAIKTGRLWNITAYELVKIELKIVGFLLDTKEVLR